MPTTLRLTSEGEFEPLAARQPLQICVTDAGAMLVQLHTLLRQTAPIIQKPENYPAAYRNEMAERIQSLLAGIPETADYEEDNEPGSWLDEEEGE